MKGKLNTVKGENQTENSEDKIKPVYIALNMKRLKL